jgi:heme-degrading monooxygenase HmoA
MYVIIWKFAVKPGLENDFESVYGPNGTWAQFFRRGRGYLETELLRDTSAPGQYVTIDRWDSKAAYEEFKKRFADDYSAIDQECEVLTESETEIGTYERVASMASDAKIQNNDKS